ncbi:MAG: ABC transporter substrate-binding protein [Verrucomicrobia bacterium]|nr:ABC transporter substrate-binding protein [Verrucomicrobiota bacterium]
MKMINRRTTVLFSLILGLTGAASVGGLFDLSGKAQAIGVSTKDVAEMIVDRINKEGGLKGAKIELVIADTQSEPSQAVVALKRIVSRDKVVAVIGPTTTGAAMACLSTIEQAGIPMVACVGGDAPVTPARKWVFKTPQRTSTAVERLFTHLRQQGLTKIGVLAASDKFGQEGEAYLKSLAPKFGLSILAQESFDPNDVDMTVQLTKVATAKPTAGVVWTIGPAGAIIARNARQAGLAMPLFQCHGQPDPNYLKLAGESANGTAMPATKLMAGEQLPAADPQRTAVLDFIKEYNARGLKNLSTHSGYAWDAVQLVAKGLEKAGTEPNALRAAIEGTKNYIGVSGVYTLSPEDHCGLGTDSLVIVKVEDGKWKMVP